jgi:ribosomal protein S18 acetylase RimI-like enzyme
MQYKTIRAADLAQADALQQKILNLPHRKRYRSFAYIRKHYLNEPSLFLGAYDKQKLVGIAFGYRTKGTSLLGEFAVDAAHRRKGAGTQLLRLFEQRARKAGAKAVQLGAEERAEHFYLRQGYCPVLFVQIKHARVPKNYRKLPFDIVNETNFRDAKRLFINVRRFSKTLKQKARRAFHAYNVMYLFRKDL